MCEEVKQSYKKSILMYLTALLVMMILYIFNFRMSNYLIIYFVIYLCQYLLLKKVNKKELLLLIGIITLNLILYELYIYLEFTIILAAYFAILTIYYVVKDTSKYKWQKILCIVLIIPLVITINLYARKDKLIKDRGLEKVISKEIERYCYEGGITLSNLEKIRRLNIWENDNVHSLEGIEHLKNLEDIEIETGGIKDLKILSTLSNLKELTISRGKLDRLLEIDNLESLEELRIGYIKVNNEHSLDGFHGLRILSIQGVELTDLSLIKELKDLEELDLSYCEIISVEGIESLANIKKLELYHTKIKNTDKIKESKSLKVIDLCASEVDNIEELKKLENPRIIIRRDVLSKFGY